MNNKYRSCKGFSALESFITLLILAIIGIVIIGGVWESGKHLGILTTGHSAFAPEYHVVATVKSKHIDSGRKDSHYMVTTDKGTFEVDNGWFLGYHADAIYGNLVEGKTYNLQVRGDEVVNFFAQQYPYITEAAELPQQHAADLR